MGEDSGDGRFSSSSCSGSGNRTKPATHKNGHGTAHSGDTRRRLQQLSSDERRRRRCFTTMWGDSNYKQHCNSGDEIKAVAVLWRN
ncbi:hypothetical protein MRB53_032943 [Persea americana]|uniref:Uncharacterized protein n=1 Tax=Persea americana TaxID=3435 RepID=A0ACC2KTV7_PERAE|nr:hypothetical protein MRB53_032943 [Persea americana]